MKWKAPIIAVVTMCLFGTTGLAFEMKPVEEIHLEAIPENGEETYGKLDEDSLQELKTMLSTLEERLGYMAGQVLLHTNRQKNKVDRLILELPVAKLEKLQDLQSEFERAVDEANETLGTLWMHCMGETDNLIAGGVLEFQENGLVESHQVVLNAANDYLESCNEVLGKWKNAYNELKGALNAREDWEDDDEETDRPIQPSLNKKSSKKIQKKYRTSQSQSHKK